MWLFHPTQSRRGRGRGVRIARSPGLPAVRRRAERFTLTQRRAGDGTERKENGEKTGHQVSQPAKEVGERQRALPGISAKGWEFGRARLLPSRHSGGRGSCRAGTREGEAPAEPALGRARLLPSRHSGGRGSCRAGSGGRGSCRAGTRLGRSLALPETPHLKTEEPGKVLSKRVKKK